MQDSMQHHSTTSLRRSKPAPVTENDVERAIVTFLKDRGWTVERNQVGLLYTSDGRPCPVGRRGQCDWRAIRPLPDAPGLAQYLEVEVKRPGAVPSKAQREYMALRQWLGVACTCADSVERFALWYDSIFTPGAAARA